MDNKNTSPPAGLAVKAGDGLFLRGLVVSSQISDRSWEGKQYKQLQVAISNGKNIYSFNMTDRNGILPQVLPGKRALIAVESAVRNKGMMTVYGNFAYEDDCLEK